VAVGAKRALAAALAADGLAFAERWHATHGPAFDDATGDNGFWLARGARSDAAETATGPSRRHAVIWYRDDPSAPTAAVAGVEIAAIGPFTVARYAPAIDYASCRDARGPVVVPVRVLPAPRRYGDGTVARAPTLPARIDCTLAPGTDATSIVAAVTAGTVTLRAAGVAGATAAASSLCLRRAGAPVPFTIETALPDGTAADLDLYERPDPDCAARKIAP
jgi:hypothetical protein